MEYRIVEKNLKFYPQEKGWSTLWFWDYFHMKNQSLYQDDFIRCSFNTYDEALDFIKDKKSKKKKIHKINFS